MDFGQFGVRFQNHKQGTNLDTPFAQYRLAGGPGGAFAHLGARPYNRCAMTRVAFMGTPEFAIPALERLAHAPFELVAVYTQPDRPAGRGRHVASSPVKVWAMRQGVAVLTPKTFRDADRVAELRRLSPDVIVVAAYGKLLPASVLQVPTKGVVNIHPSLLPKYRGPSPVAAAILAGDEITGVTIMLLDEGMDSGPILARRTEPVADDDTTLTLTRRLAERGADLLVETLPAWIDGKVAAAPQDESQATVCPKITAADGEIDWEAGAVAIERRMRALVPWPGCYTFWRGKRLKLIRARALEIDGGAPGTVLRMDSETGDGPSKASERLGIATGRGVLEIRELQPEGKRAMTCQEFLAGHADFVGERLPS